MTMFTRDDKNSNAAAAPQARTAPLAAAAPRGQATAQPLSSAPRAPVPGVSVISKALKITGQLESTEDIQIDGEVDGDVRGICVTVGSNARVKGTVYGEAVELAGTVEGKIEAKKVVLTSTAHMSGDVLHQDITIESGAYMNGLCRPEYGRTDGKIVQPAKPPAPLREPSPIAAEKPAEKPSNGASA